MNPLVSVIVPVFNCEPFLAEALQSILAQDYRPLEIIVVDDGSTDGSAAVARTFPEVTLLQQENRGVAVARNAGLAAAQGDVIMWLDADDIWLPGKVSWETRHFAANEETGFTLCHQRMFTTPGEGPPIRAPHREKWLSYSMYAAAFRRATFEQVGEFNVDCRLGEDFDWFLRAREAGVRMDTLDEIFVLHRVHASSITADIDRTRRSLLSIAKLSLNRRRQSAGSAEESRNEI